MPRSPPQIQATPHTAPAAPPPHSPQTQIQDSPYIPAAPIARRQPAATPAKPHAPPPLAAAPRAPDHSQSPPSRHVHPPSAAASPPHRPHKNETPHPTAA